MLSWNSIHDRAQYGRSSQRDGPSSLSAQQVGTSELTAEHLDRMHGIRVSGCFSAAELAAGARKIFCAREGFFETRHSIESTCRHSISEALPTACLWDCAFCYFSLISYECSKAFQFPIQRLCATAL